MMDLLLALGPAKFPQVSRIRGVRILHYFVKCTTIPAVESEIDLHGNIFVVSDWLDMLKYD